MSNSSENNNTEKHYTTAVIFTVLALYSLSVYSYFNTPQQSIANAQTAEQFSYPVELTNTLTAEVKGEESLFQPINTYNTSFVPGAACILTDRNFTPAGTFYMLPPDCDFATEGD